MNIEPAQMAAAQRAHDNAAPSDGFRCSRQHLGPVPVLVSYSAECGHVMLEGVALHGEDIDCECFSAMQLEEWRAAIQAEVDDEAAAAFEAQCEVTDWGPL